MLNIVKTSLLVMITLAFTHFISNSKADDSIQEDEEEPEFQGALLIKKNNFTTNLIFNGSVNSIERIEIKTDKKIKLSSFLVKNLDHVTKNQLLVAADFSEDKKSLNEMEERYHFDEIEFNDFNYRINQKAKEIERKRALVEKFVISKTEFDKIILEHTLMKMDYQASAIRLQESKEKIVEAKKLLKSSEFRSPIDGIISEIVSIDIDSNAEINEGTKLATVTNPKNLGFNFWSEEADTLKMKIGMLVIITLDAWPSQKIEGFIKDLGQIKKGDLNSKETSIYKSGKKYYYITVQFKNKTEALEGFVGSVEIPIAKYENKLTIPLSYLHKDSTNNFVYVSSSRSSRSKPQLREVKIGDKSAVEIDLLSGVKEGEFVFYKKNHNSL